MLDVGGGHVFEILADGAFHDAIDQFLAANRIMRGTPAYAQLVQTARWVLDPIDPWSTARFVARAPSLSYLTMTRNAPKLAIVQEAGMDTVIPPQYEAALSSELWWPMGVDAAGHAVGKRANGTFVSTFFPDATHGTLLSAMPSPSLRVQAVTYVLTARRDAAGADAMTRTLALAVIFALTFCALVAGARARLGTAAASRSTSTRRRGSAWPARTPPSPTIRRRSIYNPAGIAFQPGFGAQVGGNLIIARTHVSPDNLTLWHTAFEPTLFVAQRVGRHFAFGIGLFSEFGEHFEYPPGWRGRFAGYMVDITTANIHPTIAIRPLSWLSIGAGIDIVPASIEIFRGLDFGGGEGNVHVGADDVGIGGNVGILAEVVPHRLNIGFSYRSRVDLDFTGQAAISAPAELRAMTGGLQTARTSIPLPHHFSAATGFFYGHFKADAELKVSIWRDAAGALGHAHRSLGAGGHAAERRHRAAALAQQLVDPRRRAVRHRRAPARARASRRRLRRHAGADVDAGAAAARHQPRARLGRRRPALELARSRPRLHGGVPDQDDLDQSRLRSQRTNRSGRSSRDRRRFASSTGCRPRGRAAGTASSYQLPASATPSPLTLTVHSPRAWCTRASSTMDIVATMAPTSCTPAEKKSAA